ncbi:alpha/beta hydrolase [Fibrobacterota bacterium]
MKFFNVELVKGELAPIDFRAKQKYPPHILSYFRYYGLGLDVTHHFGTFQSQDFTLAAHVFTPEKARGAVFLLHGYYDHSGIHKNIIRLCIEKQYAVAVFDLPGHGLSTGATASIENFSQYVKAFEDFFQLCQPHVTQPYYLIGHSAGGAIALEYLYQAEKSIFEKIVLLAPLVRCSYYHLSRIGYFIVNPFSDTAPRWFRNASSDRQFLKFFHDDPLQCGHFPIKWAEAYYKWNEQVKNYEATSVPVTVIQGTKDDVVDWRHNIPFLNKRIPAIEVIYIKNARHQLMNEAEPFLSEFLNILGKQMTDLTQKHTTAFKPVKIFPVFQKSGLDSMIQVYRSNMHFLSYRLKQYLWQGFTGIRFLHFITHINEGAKASSRIPLAQCAWDVLKKLHFSLSVDWRIDLKLIKGHPVIFYAKHPGYIEPLVCLAALKDLNPKVVSTAWVANIAESVSKRIVSVPDSKEATLQELQRYEGLRKILEIVWTNTLTFQVVKHLQGDMPAAECKRQRRQAISDILSTLGGGESILIFPSGGEGQKPWVGEHTVYFEKLMRIIISNQKRIPTLADVRFVPLITKGSLRALFKSQVMMPWNPITFLFRLLPGRPFQFVIREQLFLKDLLKQKKDTREIVDYLMERLI